MAEVATVEHLISTKKVVLFVKSECDASIQIQSLVEEHLIGSVVNESEYEVVEVDKTNYSSQSLQVSLADCTKSSDNDESSAVSFPCCVIRETYYGYDELMVKKEKGMLAALVDSEQTEENSDGSNETPDGETHPEGDETPPEGDETPPKGDGPADT